MDGRIAAFDTGERGFLPYQPALRPPGASRKDLPEWKEFFEINDETEILLDRSPLVSDVVHDLGVSKGIVARDGVAAVPPRRQLRWYRHDTLSDPSVFEDPLFDDDEYMGLPFYPLVGVFHYDASDHNWMAYERCGLPTVPMHISALSDELRELMVLISLPQARFATDRVLLAPEHATEGESWDFHEFYYSLDYTAVRAMPGREHDFRALFQTDALEIPIQRARELAPDRIWPARSAEGALDP